MTIELVGVESLLAVTREDRLDGGIAALYRLQRSQCSLHPILRQMIQQGVGFLSGRHFANGNQQISSHRHAAFRAASM